MKSPQIPLFQSENQNHIYPFFWQQGQNHEILRTELEKIAESGARGVCIEARPHPDFGGPQWWSDMDLIMDYARSHQMKVWLLDDDRFPTGHANKAFTGGNHPLANRFLTMHSTDVCGPVPGGTMLVKSILPQDAELIGVVACQRRSGEDREILLDTCLDLTKQVSSGWLRWDVPQGLWRVIVLFTTCHGNGKLDYFNILDTASVRLLLDRVYEPHYEHYGKDFGETFCGFFSDEPEFANLPWYNFQARLGEDMLFIPWSGELQKRLESRWKGQFLRNLPALWLPSGPRTPHLRYEYMDETTKQLAVSFSSQIGSWCAQRGVIHVGHVIEDDNSHGRLGCGTGHYFRSLSDMGIAGIDVVLLQVLPEMDQVIHQWVASDRDGEFFHYGLAKMGSSLSHIDEKKAGNTLCEIFGAYGWQEGVGLMKWLADHMLSRGVNYFVPHAFSPRPFPDADCPPHFYAHGNQPQFRFFGDLTRYMNRLSALFSGGRFPANIAVLYHADAEWAGEAMLFQKPVRAILEHQMDCDIVPADLFSPENPYGMSFDGRIHVLDQHYEALVIPGCAYLPLAAARFAANAIRKGFLVLFVDRLPWGICEETTEEAELLEALKSASVIPLGELCEALANYVRPTVQLGHRWPRLRTYPYWQGASLYVYCFNESAERTVEDTLTVEGVGDCTGVFRYDALKDSKYRLRCEAKDKGRTVPLFLEPGEATVISFESEDDTSLEEYCPWPQKGFPLVGDWSVSFRNVQESGETHLLDCSGNGAFPDLTNWAAESEFCGSIIYETALYSIEYPPGVYQLRLFGSLDCAEITVNGLTAARLIGSPLCTTIHLTERENHLRIELPVTPVWKAGDNWSALTVLPQLGLTEKPIISAAETERA